LGGEPPKPPHSLMLPSFASSLPSISTKAENQATLAAASSDELVRMHHHATTHQNSRIASPASTLRPRPHCATPLALGRAHRARSSAAVAIGAARVELARGHAPWGSNCLSSPVCCVRLELLMLMGLASRAAPPLVHWSRQARGRGPPLPSPPSLATTIVPISCTPRCAQSS
jgi:hypothetical protein